MIQTHVLNIEESKRVLDACGSDIQLKGCYNNTFNVLRHCSRTIRERDWKAVYGYMSTIPGCMVRHAFWLDEDGRAVDPTALLASPSGKSASREYVTFRRFELDEYLDAIEREGMDPSLFRACLSEEREMAAWAQENQVILLDQPGILVNEQMRRKKGRDCGLSLD